jgi:Cytoskeletal-regulatory complex EF hand
MADDMDEKTGVPRSEETAWYAKLFALADADRDGKIAGAEAAAFLRKTGLSRGELEQIWDCVDSKKAGFLGPKEFAQALRIVAAVQQKLPLSLASMRDITRLAQFTADPSIPKPPARGGGIEPLQDADRAKYDRLFGDADVDQDGFVSGPEAQTYFSKGKLSRETLAQVWELSERDGDRKLNRAEFRVAMHLVYAALRGEKLPAELLPAVYESARVGLQPASPAAPTSVPAAHPQLGFGGGSFSGQQQFGQTGFGAAGPFGQPGFGGAPPLGAGAQQGSAYGGFGSDFGLGTPGTATGAGATRGFKKTSDATEPATATGPATGFGPSDGFSSAPSFVPDGQHPSFAGGNMANAQQQQSHLVQQHTLPGMSFEGRLELQGALERAAQHRAGNG